MRHFRLLGVGKYSSWIVPLNFVKSPNFGILSPFQVSATIGACSIDPASIFPAYQGIPLFAAIVRLDAFGNILNTNGE